MILKACEDLENLNHIKTRFYDEKFKLRELKKQGRTVEDEQRRTFLQQLFWENCQITLKMWAKVVYKHLIFSTFSINGTHKATEKTFHTKTTLTTM